MIPFQSWSVAVFAFSCLWSLSLQQIAYIPAFIAWGVAGWRKGFVWSPTRVDGALLVFVVATIIGAFWGTDPENSLRGLPKTLGWMGVFVWTVHAVERPRQIRWAALWLMISALTQSLFGLVALKWWPGKYSEIGGWGDWLRIFGTMSHPIFLGEGLAMALVFGLAWVWWSGQARKWVWGVLSLPVLVCLGLTYSRGAWLGLLLGILVLGVFVSRKILVFLLLLLMGSGIAIKAFPDHPLVARVKSIVSTQNESNRERLDMWGNGWKMALRHPFGIGVDNAERTQQREGILSPSGKSFSVLHSNYVQVLVDRGWLGLIAFCWWTTLAVWVLLRGGLNASSPEYRAAAMGSGASMVVFLVSGLTEYNYGTARVVMIMWFLLGLGFAALRLDQLGAKDLKV